MFLHLRVSLSRHRERLPGHIETVVERPHERGYLRTAAAHVARRDATTECDTERGFHFRKQTGA